MNQRDTFGELFVVALTCIAVGLIYILNHS